MILLANELCRFLGWPLTDVSTGFAAGSVSTGFIQATPGDMKSFRSSAERIALILTIVKAEPAWRRVNDFAKPVG
jgi:hypothetical protein